MNTPSALSMALFVWGTFTTDRPVPRTDQRIIHEARAAGGRSEPHSEPRDEPRKKGRS